MPKYIFLLFLFHFSTVAEELTLLEEYKAFQPFIENVESATIGFACTGEGEDEECEPVVKIIDNTDALNDIVERTKQKHNASDPSFLSTPLGRQYKNLKKFLEIREGFKTCKSNAVLWTERAPRATAGSLAIKYGY